ncbi:pyruvate dehydrogenase (acetyl-transferring), homodimeric type [Alteromonas sp. a30]|uniref:pyruvate dehydrogenase (acetyl-transferring), homodimeric type n=1 Tax=Alteromonas sp. a30 TaxID=2730917 RepID=UPI002282C0C8|nr:pyruvate dehydrogenase (acetyl-transferring), homodimeric type [Alteromonas sp. a30]MCY7296486.1 pyruvate dehydrogenase (acetyl-transferring), homodimeric type [Alteromonas sp. a30]
MQEELIQALSDDEHDWLESLAYIKHEFGPDGVKYILSRTQEFALDMNLDMASSMFRSRYLNTIPQSEQPEYPGDMDMEKRIENLIRWNALAMVLQGVDSGDGLGGHIATYASAATLFEVGFNHVFKGASENREADIVMPQPHAAPGFYARAYIEGRLSEQQLKNFRRELGEGGGLCSYPHPRSMPDFWEVPNASMGLSVPSVIYQARFSKYLENRGLKSKTSGKIWCFIGDGESDEPEVIGSLNIAAREKLDNLVLVVNCNLQRLDGPVRGNGKIIKELERSFAGANWNILKVIWGGSWDALLAKDIHGELRRRMDECVDGDYQMYSIKDGKAQREHWVGNNQELQRIMEELSDDEIKAIKRGGQDPEKIYAAFAQAEAYSEGPTVILVKTVKGEALGQSIQGRNTAHQKKTFSPEERIQLAKDYGIPLSDEEAAKAVFYRPPESSPEMQYLRAQREKLGGYLPQRKVEPINIKAPDYALFESIFKGSGDREVSTTTAMVRIISLLCKDKDLGKLTVPIVPDEARTFGMDGLFKQMGIYSSEGQNYQPVDADTLLPYTEAKDGQILQEGICEAGAMASFMAAGTSYAVHGIPTIPFYIFYSMFGFQRVGDMIWACADMMAKGFLLGGTAGRTTLNGEGLQHQDGHSLVLASTVPCIKSYDPAFGYELAIIVREGIRRMYENQENIFYYLMVYNQNYVMPALENIADYEQGVLKGGYCLEKASTKSSNGSKANKSKSINLLASGAIMQEALLAKSYLTELGYAVNIFSITSFIELEREAQDCLRDNRLHPTKTQKIPYVAQMLSENEGVFLAVTDYVKSLANSIARWVPGPYEVLGTDGFGLSEARDTLRAHYEVDQHHIVHGALSLLLREGRISQAAFKKHSQGVVVDTQKTNPRFR